MSNSPTNDELAGEDAVGLADRIRRGDLSPVEAVQATIDRIERLDGDLNAVIHKQFEDALELAASPDLPDGPFRGVPMLLKDLWAEEAGRPHHAGIQALKDADHRFSGPRELDYGVPVDLTGKSVQHPRHVGSPGRA